jgi:O-antigen/teichoic acid export membrane protein
MNRSVEFIKNTLMTLISQGLTLVLALGSSIVIARVLGPEGQGLYSLLIMLPAVLIAFTNFGIGSASVYYIGKKQFSLPNMLGANIMFSMLFSLVAIFIALIIVVFFSGKAFPGITSQYLLLSLTLIPCQLFFNYGLNFLLGVQNIKKYNLMIVFRSLIFLALLSIFYFSSLLGVITAIVSLFLSFSLICVLLFYEAKKEANGVIFSINRTMMKAFWGYGGKVYLANIFAMLHKRIDIFLINIFLNPLAVGYYAIAAALSERIWLISQSAGTVLFPRVSSETNDKRLKEFTPRVCRNILMITLLIAVSFYFISRWLITFFYSDQYAASVFPFQILLIGMVSISGSRILSTDLAGRNKVGANILLNLLSLTINIVLNIVLIPPYGIAGAAWATTISYTITFAGRILVYSSISGNKMSDIIFIKKTDLIYYKNLYARFVWPNQSSSGNPE